MTPPDKTCNFCGKVCTAYTFTNNTTICPTCFSTMPTDLEEAWRIIHELRKVGTVPDNPAIPIDEAREYLKWVMQEHFTDKTFSNYIAFTMAGDFAAEIAQVIRLKSAQAGRLDNLLRNLLAVIHRDGGQHAVEHGLQKSTEDAIESVLCLLHPAVTITPTIPRDQKQPRLFYYEEAENKYIPAPDHIENLIDLDTFPDGEIIEIMFKRLDLTDEEMDALPEC